MPKSKTIVPQPTLMPTPLLFRFSVPCRHFAGEMWTPLGVQLEGEHRIPSFAELDGVPSWADLRVGWNDAGLVINLSVEGKSMAPWCRESRLEDSDGLSVWIDTRDTHNVHRASRFCHMFQFFPAGGGRKFDKPLAIHQPIHRAKENPGMVAPSTLKLRTEKLRDGYRLEAHIPAEALTGYDPAEHLHLGFNYAVMDRELGEQTLSVGSEFPVASDPSLWGTLELIHGA